MEAIQLLTQQHRLLETLLGETLKSNNAQEKLNHFKKAADKLSIHIHIEEQVFYPAVHANRNEDILLESLEEHLSLKRLLSDLLELKPDHTTFEPKMKVLKEQAEHHHKEEEENLFPKVKKALSESQRVELGAQMEALQSQLQQQPAAAESVKQETASAAPLV